MGDAAFLGRPCLAGPPGASLLLICDYGEIERLMATVDVEREAADVRKALSKLGFEKFLENTDGFTARRSTEEAVNAQDEPALLAR
jgi:hypothetical protein